MPRGRPGDAGASRENGHTPAHGSPGLCRVLEEDRDLAEAVGPACRAQATRECLSRTLTLPSGRRLQAFGDAPRGSLGLLVLDGLLIRRVGVDGRFGAELLGVGDLLRPWQEIDAPPMLGVVIGWRVLDPARVAVLDRDVARRLSRYPEVTSSLVGRALERSRNLAVIMAIVHQARVDVRLHMLFWHLAARWGKVRSDRVTLPLRLTHGVLADLTAAARPTVTSALSELARKNLVRPANEGWELFGRAPGQLLELQDIPEKLAAAESQPTAADGSEAPAAGRL